MKRTSMLPATTVILALGSALALGIQARARSGTAAVTPPAPTHIGQTWTRPTDGAVMVAVPAGEFTMGADDCGDGAKPPHQVTLDGYWIDKNDITVAQYRKFCDATGTKMPDAPSWGWQDDNPIVNVSWNDAKAYCDWAGAALPTEAQWEKAARGADGRKYPWGNDWDAGRLWSSVDGQKSRTARVGSFPSGASPYGCLDMAGNVWQWCADWYDASYYQSAPTQNPTGPGFSKDRVLRGGSWGLNIEIGFRCADRFGSEPVGRGNDGGFRCVVRGDSSPQRGAGVPPKLIGGSERGEFRRASVRAVGDP